MIRFMPDNWLDVVMRPLDMISPDANIYVEVAAPDLRLAAALLLAVAVLASSGRKRPDGRPAFQLLALTLLAMVPWLVTTGNGRYITAFLLLLGPLCVGLVRLLPLSASLRFSAVGVLLLGQLFLIYESSPWGSWALMSWRAAPYFQLATPPAQPRSYVTLTPISFSLIAPQFPEQSRWMNLSAPLRQPREQAYARKWLADARSLYLVAPSYPSQMAGDQQPSAEVIGVFNHLIANHGLSLIAGSRCDFLRSGGLAGLAVRYGSPDIPESALASYGFWLCPLHYDPAAEVREAAEARDPVVDATFEAVEKLCPRFFTAGDAVTRRFEGGAIRHYNSDTRVYVMDDGEVLYKFWRSINPVTIGRRADVLAGRAHVDCSKIRAPTWRSGGP